MRRKKRRKRRKVMRKHMKISRRRIGGKYKGK